MTTFAEMINQTARDLMRDGTEDREAFVKAWVMETGVPPSEAEMVEVVEAIDGGMRRTITVQRKEER